MVRLRETLRREQDNLVCWIELGLQEVLNCQTLGVLNPARNESPKCCNCYKYPLGAKNYEIPHDFMKVEIFLLCFTNCKARDYL